MNGTKRIKITTLNPNLICVLCGGYLIDATTLTECLHSFCKKCIVRYLESSKHCPVCDVMVHKTRPHQNIRSDKTLQDLVYKLVPGLYKNEMKRRRDYYTQHPEAAPKKVGEARGDENAERIIYTEDEIFSLALHFCSEGIKDERSVRTLSLPEIGATTKEPPKDVRYLQCPASVTIGILKKFIRLKYELPQHYQIDVFHTDEALREEYTLMDVAYIYTWRRREPLRLNYSVYENTIKRMRLDNMPSKRVGLALKPHVKSENKQGVKPAADAKSSKQDTKLAKSEKSPVKQETKQSLKQESKPSIKEELLSRDKDKVQSQETDKKSETVEKAEKPSDKPNGEIVVGHVAAVSDPSKPVLTSAAGKKFFSGKPSKPAYGVKVLQSSKPPSAGTYKVKAVVGGAGVKISSVSKAGQDKAKACLNSQPASASHKSASVKSDSVPTGQNGVVSSSDQNGKVLAGEAGLRVVGPSTGSPLVHGQKVGEAGAAGAAASAADVVAKTTRQLQPPPAASPAATVTASPSSTPVTLTSVSRSSDSPAVTLSSTTGTSLSSVTVTASPCFKSSPSALSTGVLTVPVPSAPAPVDAGAAAAGGDASPAPAALAASSSPSPPMSTSTAASKDPSKQFSTPSAVVTTASQSPAPSPKPLSAAPNARPNSSSSKTSLTPIAANRPVTATSTNTKLTTPSVAGLAASPLPGRVLSPKTGSDKDRSPSSSPSVKKGRKSSPARAADSINNKIMNPTNGNNNNNGSSTVNGSVKVPVGSQTVVSCNTTPKSVGRVCNGMPPVVTRMPRVSNAATSVNTLSQNQNHNQPSSGTTTLKLTTLKLPGTGNAALKQASLNTQKQASVGTTPQKQSPAGGTAQKQPPGSSAAQKLSSNGSAPEKQTTAGSTQQKVATTAGTLQRTVTLSRPSGASTPIPIQPAGMTPTSHSLVRSPPMPSVAVAMARRASEMQQAFVQQQQQQLIIQQHLLEQQRLQQLFQQQQLLTSLQVAAAARWKNPQASTTLTPIPITQAGIVVNASPLFNGNAKNQATAPAAETPNGRSDAEKVQSKKSAVGNGQSKQPSQLPQSKKSPEQSSSKKKISDIANSLHKKMSQNGATSPQKPSAASPTEQRPPTAHSLGVKRPDAGSLSPTQAHSAGSKSPVAVEQAPSKGEDEQPLNLSVGKETPRANGGLPARDPVQPVSS